MDKQVLPKDFSEFLKLLNKYEGEYLLIGGYAVGCHGYPRTTADMDVWVAVHPVNASDYGNGSAGRDYRSRMQTARATEAVRDAAAQ